MVFREISLILNVWRFDQYLNDYRKLNDSTRADIELNVNTKRM